MLRNQLITFAGLGWSILKDSTDNPKKDKYSNINFRFTLDLAVNILIAEDFTLNGKSTNLVSIVKSSKMIHSPLS
ncbi:MAG: hypothetical protein E2589_09485 [Chryseobacterium sp.]|nr:hypothetical protein [Chryseobacterium sp.]